MPIAEPGKSGLQAPRLPGRRLTHSETDETPRPARRMFGASSLLPAAAGAGPERSAPCRAEGGAREGEREGKGERELPRMLGIIPLPFGKPQPQSRRARRVRPAPAPRPDRPAAARSAAMATSPQKSPSVPKSPTPKSPPSRKKDDSFLGKLGGTLARRKKAKEGECGPGRAGNLGAGAPGVGRERAAGARRRGGGRAVARARAARERLAGPVLAAARLAVAWALALPGPEAVGWGGPGLGSESARAGPGAEEAAGPSCPEATASPRPEVPAFSAPKAGSSQVSAETFLGAFTLTFCLHWSLKSDLFLVCGCSLGLLELLSVPRAKPSSVNA